MSKRKRKSRTLSYSDLPLKPYNRGSYRDGHNDGYKWRKNGAQIVKSKRTTLMISNKKSITKRKEKIENCRNEANPDSILKKMFYGLKNLFNIPFPLSHQLVVLTLPNLVVFFFFTREM